MSYDEPTVSGFEELDRQRTVIPTSNPRHLHVYRTIDRIPDYFLEPSGIYPIKPGVFMRRTPKNSRTQVLLCLLDSRIVIEFRIIFDTHDFVCVQVPIDSWHRQTCDAEAVRAAIQQAWLNITKGQPSPSIVNPHHRCLRVMTEEEYYYNHSPPRPQYRRQRTQSLSPPYDPYQSSRLPPQYYRPAPQQRIHGSSQDYHPNGYQGNQAYYYQTTRRPERRSLLGRFFS